MTLRRTPTILLLLVSSCAFAQKTYTLRLNPPLGKTYRYVTKVSAAGAPGGFELSMSMKAVKETANTVVLETKILDITSNGKSMGAMFGKFSMAITEDRYGHTQHVDVSGAPPNVAEQLKKMGAGASSSASFPNHPIKVGDTWTGQSTTMGQATTVTYKMVGVKPVGGSMAAVLQTTPSSKQVKFKEPMTFYIELSTGMLIKGSASFTANGQNASFEITKE
jgi:hypothetical protein